MDELKKLVAELMEKAKEQKVNLLDVVKAVPTAKDALFQPVFEDGLAHGVARSTDQLSKMEKRATDAEAAITAANKKIEKLSDQNPEAAKIHEQYKKEVERLEAEVKAAKDAGSAQVVELKRENAGVMLRAALVELGVNPMYAEVTALRPAIRDRIKIDEKTKNTSVIQAGKEIPYAGSEHEQIKSFASELFEATPAEWRKSGVSGNGTGTTTTSGTQTADAAAVYQKIRDEAKARADKLKQTNSGDELNRRTGHIST